MKPYRRAFVSSLKKALRDHPDLIHVVLGPRQVGKTTGVLQLLEDFDPKKTIYVSADGDIARPSSWLLAQWLIATQKGTPVLLVIDEIQKIENWSEAVKQIWDEQARSGKRSRIQLVLLGSSSLHIQKGLSESLTGRFKLHPAYHWDFEESVEAFQLSLEEYLRFGGYPRSYSLRKERGEWLQYVKHSIIDPVLGKDILSVARVKSPALFKQCFDLACSYAAREISYTKLLGQLQDKGNTDLVKYYLELFEGAFLIKQLFKFSNKKTLSRGSSPKILPLCPALYSCTLDAELDEKEQGRAFELMVGAALHTLPGELFYWREKNREVDYVLRFGKRVWAIEVKWKSGSAGGLETFKQKFPSAELHLVTPDYFQKFFKYLRHECKTDMLLAQGLILQ